MNDNAPRSAASSARHSDWEGTLRAEREALQPDETGFAQAVLSRWQSGEDVQLPEEPVVAADEADEDVAPAPLARLGGRSWLRAAGLALSASVLAGLLAALSSLNQPTVVQPAPSSPVGVLVSGTSEQIAEQSKAITTFIEDARRRLAAESLMPLLIPDVPDPADYLGPSPADTPETQSGQHMRSNRTQQA